jgi:hypothetical protein
MRLILGLLLGALTLCAETYYVTVAGIGGDPEYDKRFESWAAEAAKALPNSETLRAATRDALRAALSAVAGKATPGDEFVLLLIGHGTFDGAEYKFNLRGPDVTARELASLLDKIPAARQLVVNTTSASGGSLEALRKPGRIVVTATKSGTEKNATQFARHWVEALRDPAADTDKNEAVSAMEAFRYAERKTQAFYAGNGNIATEHPRIDGEGSAFVLARYGQTATAYTDPSKRALLARREQLERQIADLKLRKAAMPTDEYRKRLTALLVDLARTQQELDK